MGAILVKTSTRLQPFMIYLMIKPLYKSDILSIQ